MLHFSEVRRTHWALTPPGRLTKNVEFFYSPPFELSAFKGRLAHYEVIDAIFQALYREIMRR